MMGQAWYQPDLAQWRDHLLQQEALQATSTRDYLSTVRSAYRQLLRSNKARQWLYGLLPSDWSVERRLAVMTEFETRLKNAIDPLNSPVTVIKKQDEADSDHLWLTPSQVASLVLSPGVDTLKGLRDTAMIALMLCTGLRAAELLAVDVEDLQMMFGSTLALRVQSGKGAQQRLVPYGAQDWGLTLAQAWCDQAGLSSGAIFVSMRKGDNFFLNKDGQHVRLSERALEYALREYPLSIDGELHTVTPHDLRHTYARRLYLTGTDLTAIQQNMGHESQDTTLRYIGRLDAGQRAPDDAYGTIWLKSIWETLSVGPDIQIQDRDEHTPETPPPAVSHGGYVFKMVLHDISPQIWRRFKVPAGISFHTLHNIIQVVMGWENYHLYRFALDFMAFTEQLMGPQDRSSSNMIDPYLERVGLQLIYEYDFGDLWGHILTLEKYLSREVVQPHCLAGNRACPPEDCGGPWIYNEFLRSRRSRKGRVSQKWKHRMGSYWDADAFDLDGINQSLKLEWRSMR